MTKLSSSHCHLFAQVRVETGRRDPALGVSAHPWRGSSHMPMHGGGQEWTARHRHRPSLWQPLSFLPADCGPHGVHPDGRGHEQLTQLSQERDSTSAQRPCSRLQALLPTPKATQALLSLSLPSLASKTDPWKAGMRLEGTIGPGSLHLPCPPWQCPAVLWVVAEEELVPMWC